MYPTYPEKKKEKSFIKKFNKTIKEIIPTSDHLKLGILLGFLALLWYTASNGIPFPVSLTELPTLLIATLLVSLIIGVYFVVGLIIPMNFPISFDRWYAKKCKFDTSSSSYGERYQPFFYFLFIPLFAAILTIYASFFFSIDSAMIWISIVVIISFIYGLIKYIKKGNIIKACGYYIPQCFLLAFPIAIMSIVPIVIVGNDFFETPVILRSVALLLLTLFILGMYYFPLHDKSKNLSSYEHKMFYLVITVVVAMSSLIYPVSLKLLKLGGGYRAIYTFSDNYYDQIHDSIKCKYSLTNRSKQLLVILSLGDDVYVKLEDEENSNILSIPKVAIVEKYYPGKKNVPENIKMKDQNYCDTSLLKI